MYCVVFQLPLFTDDPVFWDRVLLSQDHTSSSSLATSAVSGSGVMDSRAVKQEARPVEEGTGSGGHPAIKRFKSSQ